MQSIICLGGASLDRKYHFLSTALPATSNPAHATRSFGGVARNVAENLARLGVPVALFSRLGADEGAVALLDHARSAGIDVRYVQQDPTAVTAEYAAMLAPDGALLIGAADARAVEAIAIEDIAQYWSEIERAGWLFLDCNIPAAAIAWCIERAQSSPVKIAVDAVSDAKVMRLPADLRGVDLLVLNRGEAGAYLGRAESPEDTLRALLQRNAGAVVLTLGAKGIVVADGAGIEEVSAVSAACADETGAGDALVAALLWALAGGDTLQNAARTAVLAAALTVESPFSVRPDLSPALIAANRIRLEKPCTNS